MAVVDESLNPFLESARNYLKFLCDGIVVPATGKSDVVKGLGCYDYAVVVHHPTKEKEAACLAVYSVVSVSFGWVAKEQRTIFFGECLNFVDDVRFRYLDDGEVWV